MLYEQEELAKEVKYTLEKKYPKNIGHIGDQKRHWLMLILCKAQLLLLNHSSPLTTHGSRTNPFILKSMTNFLVQSPCETSKWERTVLQRKGSIPRYKENQIRSSIQLCLCCEKRWGAGEWHNPLNLNSVLWVLSFSISRSSK